MTTPLYDAFLDDLDEIGFLKNAKVALQALTAKYGADHSRLAEDVLTVANALGWDTRDVFAQYIFDYLKEQRRFEKKGDYGHHDFDEIKAKILDNEQTMTQMYLPGLFLSYPLTAVLFVKYAFFKQRFLPRLSQDMAGTEVGYGDGFYLWVLLNGAPGVSISGFDISPHAKPFAENLLATAGVDPSRHDLQIGNVFEGLPIEPNSLDFALLAEIIEHIPNPVDAIVEMGRRLKPGGLLYVATMIDCNHMDHISNFEGPEEVEGLITGSGFAIEDELVYRVTDDLPESRDRAVSIAFIARKL